MHIKRAFSFPGITVEPIQHKIIMQPILILTLVAVASSTSWGWSFAGYSQYVVPSTDSSWQRFTRRSPAQQSAQQIGREIQEAQNAIQERDLGSGIKSEVAQQTARGVVEQALLARQGQTIEGIQQLEQRQRVSPQNIAQQITTNQAIERLQNQLLFQQSVAPVITATSQLAKTLEAAIAAQLTLEDVDAQQQSNSGVFLAKVEQLVDENIIQQIQAEIGRQQAKIQQLQQQKVLVNQQQQQVQDQLSSGQQGQESRIQLQETQQQLQFQQGELVNQEVARQLIIQQLQQALIEQQLQLQEDILGEFQSQSYVQGVRQRVANLRQYGPLRSQSWNPWTIYGNSWSG